MAKVKRAVVVVKAPLTCKMWNHKKDYEVYVKVSSSPNPITFNCKTFAEPYSNTTRDFSEAQTKKKKVWPNGLAHWVN